MGEGRDTQQLARVAKFDIADFTADNVVFIHASDLNDFRASFG